MSVPPFNLYIKPGCGWCDEAVDWLEARGYVYGEINVYADAAAYAEMKRISGQTLCPTLAAGDEVLPDFDTDQLEQFLKERGWLAAA